jgi:hypothetical protein
MKPNDSPKIGWQRPELNGLSAGIAAEESAVVLNPWIRRLRNGTSYLCLTLRRGYPNLG